MNVRSVIAVVLCIAIVAPFTTGCLGDSSSGDDTTTVKTMDEYRQEATQSISESNADAELNKLLSEIDGDAP